MGPSVSKEDGDGRPGASLHVSVAPSLRPVTVWLSVYRVEPMEVDLTPSPLRRVSSLFPCVSCFLHVQGLLLLSTNNCGRSFLTVPL